MEIQALLAKHPDEVAAMRGSIDLIAGGPPCQGFSFAGKRNGEDPRNQMLLHYIKVVDQVRPKMILIENVKGIASKHSTAEEAYADVLKRKLGELRYACVAKIIRAVDYCVPQERPRFILMGIDRDAFPGIALDEQLELLWQQSMVRGRQIFLEASGFDGKAVTTRQAISDLETAGKVLVDCVDAPGRLCGSAAKCAAVSAIA